MPRLGEILVGMKACTPQQVREGLENQVIFGGRLGTNLLEIGHLDEETLARALGRRHQVPCLYGKLGLDPATLALLRADLVDRLEVVPYLVQDRKLALLVCDPNDLPALDEVAFATGKRVHPIVVPEARMWVLMRAFYGLDRQLRGIEVDFARPGEPVAGRGKPEAGPSAPAPGEGELMGEEEFHSLYDRRLAEAEERAAEGRPAPGGDDFEIVELTDVVPEAPPPLAPPAGSLAPPVPAGEAAPLPQFTPPPEPWRAEVLAALLRDEGGRPPPGPAFTPVPAQTPAVQVPEPEPAPLDFPSATRALEGVEGRASIARTVLRYARSRFRRALLLTVQRGAVQGWEGLGEGLPRRAVRRIRVRLAAPGVLSTVVATRAHFLGPFPKTDENLRFLKALGGGVPRNAFVVPVLGLGRVVNLLYLDNGRGGTVDGAEVGELLILATKIAQSYEALISRVGG